MQIRHKCWNCRNKFLASVSIPSIRDVTCPQCGMGVREWIPTKLQRAKGMRYWLIASARVGRLGRERQQLWEQSRRDTINKFTDRREEIHRGVPKF